MRFSLLTLLLATLTVGSLVGCWMLGEPWAMARRVKNDTRTKADAKAEFFATGFEFKDRPSLAPDGHRVAASDYGGYVCLYRSPLGEYKPDDLILFRFPHYGEFYFINDDTALIYHWMHKNGDADIDFNDFEVWHRRYPEWWWGHCYRPEVWSAILFGVLLFLNVFREYRAKGTAKARRA